MRVALPREHILTESTLVEVAMMSARGAGEQMATLLLLVATL